jgi:hypothetical protein
MLKASEKVTPFWLRMPLCVWEWHCFFTSWWWCKLGRAETILQREQTSLGAGRAPVQLADTQKAKSSYCKEAGCLGQQLYQWIISWKERNLWRPCTIFDLRACTQWAGLSLIQRKWDNCLPNRPSLESMLLLLWWPVYQPPQVCPRRLSCFAREQIALLG